MSLYVLYFHLSAVVTSLRGKDRRSVTPSATAAMSVEINESDDTTTLSTTEQTFALDINLQENQSSDIN